MAAHLRDDRLYRQAPVLPMRLTTLQRLILLAALSACGDAATAPDTGRLSVTISGLPTG
ncbi:MAG: hypothetical protein H0W30_16700, partial [Gemmatimonadaceae bacterium]|nr:hypothetical protein [Gemmatimonadaceae bacterium]